MARKLVDKKVFKGKKMIHVENSKVSISGGNTFDIIAEICLIIQHLGNRMQEIPTNEMTPVENTELILGAINHGFKDILANKK